MPHSNHKRGNNSQVINNRCIPTVKVTKEEPLPLFKTSTVRWEYCTTCLALVHVLTHLNISYLWTCRPPPESLPVVKTACVTETCQGSKLVTHSHAYLVSSDDWYAPYHVCRVVCRGILYSSGFQQRGGLFHTCSVILLAFYAVSLLNLLLLRYNWQFIFRIFHMCYLSHVIHLRGLEL